MKKLDMQSPNIVSENIAKIAALFPNCITEGADGKVIDFDLLKQELSAEIVEGNKERYRLEWPGKREAIVTANIPTQKTLRPIREDSVQFDSTENVYIEGDNLEVLKILQESYLGKIKMIYIDPPYNTGKDFVYKDNFRKDAQEELFDSGQTDEYNQRLVANPDTAGRYHSDWLTMMYPRLKLARNLLTDDGVIFISIDDNEVHNLRKVCDEVFGVENFIDCIIWKKRYGGGAKEKYLVSLHEYTLVFAKNEISLQNFKIPLTEESIKRYYKSKDLNFLKRGPYRTHPLEATKSMGERKNLVYDIPAPDGTLVSPKRQWLWSKERTLVALENGELEFLKSKNGSWSVHTKQYLKNRSGLQRTGKPFSIFDSVYTQHGTNEIIDLFKNAQIFSFPKPTKFIAFLLNIGFDLNNGIILDFFSGSAASANAVLNLNAEDNGSRKYIQVQIPEATDQKSEAYKAGYKNICEIGKERIRRAGQKIKAEQLIIINEKRAKLEKAINGQLAKANGKYAFPENVIIDETAENMLSELNDLQAKLDNLDIGFRVYRLDSSNMKDVYYRPQDYTQTLLDNLYNNVKEDRNAEDLLTQVLLDWGLPLSLPIERVMVVDKTVFKVAGNSLYACFDKNIDEDFAKAIAKEKPLRVVFRDGSFKNDTAKVNVQQLLKQLSSATDMRVI